ncbi:PH domain-containing protein [Longispora sp. K20-0274]|uniref:PH domain-containing protein n=1 Tax=Longispora sp. K20-0274 TaxID=3088255 RepID=UPI00399B7A87
MATAGLRPIGHNLAVFLGPPLVSVALYLAAWAVAPADYEYMIGVAPAFAVLSGFGLANRWYDWAPVTPRVRALLVRRGRFTAPAHLVRRAVGGGLGLGFVACFAAQPLLRGHGSALVLYAPVVLAASAITWVPRPRVELSPAGVTLRREAGRRVFVGWDQITLIGYGPGGPDVFVHAAGRPPFELGARRLATHPAILADALWYYRHHPEHRPAVGTVAEHDRLLTELAGLSDAPPGTLPSARAARWTPGSG